MEQSSYCSELEPVLALRPEQITRQTFLEAYIATVLGSGYKWSIVEGFLPQFKAALRNYDVDAIASAPNDIRVAALNVFHHERKIDAIIWMAQRLASEEWDQFKAHLTGADRLEFIDSFHYIGPVTKYELAKNIGLDYAKPDRLMRRIAGEFGYTDTIPGVFDMVRDLQNATGKSPRVIDSILWRYEEQHRPAG
jgi:hypothetical protein